MAAYAALVSLMHIIEQIQHHPRPSISLDEEQVKSLGKKIAFLQDFLESYSHDRSCKGMESHIAEAAYAAEDVIESRIVDQILDGSTDHVVEISSSELHKDLQKVIQEMEFIIIEVVEIKRKRGIHDMFQQNPKSAPDELHRDSLVSGGSNSSRSSSMVGNEDVLNDIMEKLIGQQSNRQIIPIVGMGGIVHKLGFGAKLKSCGIHDPLRDLCLREAQETKFLCVKRHHSINIPQGINTQRRVAIHQSSSKKVCLPQVVSLQSVPSLTLSLICDAPKDIPSLNLRLLRVLKADDKTLCYGDLH